MSRDAGTINYKEPAMQTRIAIGQVTTIVIKLDAGIRSIIHKRLVKM